MEEKKQEFLQTTFLQLLNGGTETTRPLWGKMNFQQMVEHLILAFKSANGSLSFKEITTTQEHREKLIAFVMSDKLFKPETKSPVLPDEPLPIKYATLAEALLKLKSEVDKYFTVFTTEPTKVVRNPVFGDLDFKTSNQLLYKHVLHHLTQFGLIDTNSSK
jgi:hypothetical protein